MALTFVTCSVRGVSPYFLADAAGYLVNVSAIGRQPHALFNNSERYLIEIAGTGDLNYSAEAGGPLIY